MAISTEQNAQTFLSIVADTPTNNNYPLFAEDEIVVIYGSQALEAIPNVDYTVQLSPPNYNSFTVTPLESLLIKIDALIASPPTDEPEINYITVRRKLDNLTSVSPEIVRSVAFLSREIDRMSMRFIQIKEQMLRALIVSPRAIGAENTQIVVEPPTPGAIAVWGPGYNLVNGPNATDIVEAEANAAASAAAAAASAAALSATSASSVSIGAGTKNFVIEAGKIFTTGDKIIAIDAADPANYMHGTCTGYVGTALSLNAESFGGSGTITNWVIRLSGDRGAAGPAGAPGAGTGDMLGANNLSDVADPNAALVNLSGAKRGVNNDITSMTGLTTYLALPQDFRLTLTANTPVTILDVTSTTLYLTPYKGNAIALWDGAKWQTYNSAQVSLALSGMANGRPYDVFAYWSGSAVTLERLAWTNDTTRATALAYQNGILIKSGDATRRYLGAFYTVATNQTTDSVANRYLWNYYNRVPRSMARFDPASSWTYNGAARQANGNALNQLNFVVGAIEDTVSACVSARAFNLTNNPDVECSIGFNGVTSAAALPGAYGGGRTEVSNARVYCNSSCEVLPALGRNYLAWLEYSAAGGTTNWESGGVFGLQGKVFA